MVKPNTQEWDFERMGKFTGSAFYKLMGYPERKSLATGAQTYVLECVGEELGDEDRFEGNANTEWGHEYEPFAGKEYEIQTGQIIKPGELVIHNDHVGCTPDGFFGEYELNEQSKIVTPPEGIAEIKCPPKKANHIKYLMVENGADLLKAEKQYYWQCQGNMMVTGAQYCIFITYHPHFNGLLKMGSARIERSEDHISQLRMKLALAILRKREIYRKLKVA